MPKWTALIVVIIGLMLADAGPSSASVERIDDCEIAATHLRCEASGTVRNPHRLRVRVASGYRYRVSGDWTTVCFNWSQRRRRAGYFVEEPPSFVRRIPMAFWRPDRCRVRVSLAGGFDAMFSFGLDEGRFAKLVLQSRV